MFVLVYASKLCFLDRESVSNLQDDKIKHMNIFFNGIKTIKKVAVLDTGDAQGLLVTTNVISN